MMNAVETLIQDYQDLLAELEVTKKSRLEILDRLEALYREIELFYEAHGLDTSTLESDIS